MKDASTLSLKARVGFVASVVLLLHILISLIILLIPRPVGNSTIMGLMYNRLVLIGPFFQESRIKTSPHLYVSYYDNNLWTPPRDYALENFYFYSGHPWRYGKLRMNYYDRYISNKVGKLNETVQLSDVKDSQAFRELHQFVMEEYLKRPVDSIALVYGLNHYVPQTNTTRFDTTFAYTYNPAEIAPAKLVY